VVERYIKKGLLDEKEYQRHLKSLDDLSEKAGNVETEFTSLGELGPTR
jgi:tetrahydromethanopterin S-methyltransferase subunit G